MRYESDLHDNPFTSIDKWLCERCRQICVLAPHQKDADIEAMQCHFCPTKRGILKRVMVNGKEVWVKMLAHSCTLSVRLGRFLSCTRRATNGYTTWRSTPAA